MRARHLLTVESDNLLSVGYSADSFTLEVVFRTAPDHVYSYRPVQPLEFVELVSADSIGTHFTKHFKGRYTAAKKFDRNAHLFTKSEAPEDLFKVLAPHINKKGT